MSADDPTHAPRRAPLSPLKRLARSVAIVLGGVFALVVLSAFAYMRYYALQRDAALERIRAAGDPVLAADIPQSAVPDQATLAWMRALVALRETVADWDAVAGAEPAAYREHLAEIAASDAPAAVREAALAFDRVVLGEAELAGGGDDGLRTALAAFENAWEPASYSRSHALRVAWLEFVTTDGAAHCELAHAARGLAPITLRESRALTPDEPAWIAGLEPWRTFALVSALSWRAQLRELQGDFAGAADDARAILDIAALESKATDITGVMDVARIQLRYLGTVDRLLEIGPPGPETAQLQTQLPIEPLLAALRFATRAERALWNERCAEQRARGLFSTDDDVFPTRQRPWTWLFRARNHTWMLSEYERLIPEIEVPSNTRTSWVRERPTPDGTRLGDLRHVAVFEARDVFDELTLRGHFLRIGVAWREQGANAAEECARASMDPFSGLPLRCGRTGDKLRVWSVGANGRDEGGKQAITFRGADDILFERGDT